MTLCSHSTNSILFGQDGEIGGSFKISRFIIHKIFNQSKLSNQWIIIDLWIYIVDLWVLLSLNMTLFTEYHDENKYSKVLDSARKFVKFHPALASFILHNIMKLSDYTFHIIMSCKVLTNCGIDFVSSWTPFFVISSLLI